MKILPIVITALVAGLSLNSCATNQKLTKPQRCVGIDRQIAAYQHPNSGYSWNVAQMKIQQLREQSQELGCNNQ